MAFLEQCVYSFHDFHEVENFLSCAPTSCSFLRLIIECSLRYIRRLTDQRNPKQTTIPNANGSNIEDYMLQTVSYSLLLLALLSRAGTL